MMGGSDTNARILDFHAHCLTRGRGDSAQANLPCDGKLCRIGQQILQNNA